MKKLCLLALCALLLSGVALAEGAPEIAVNAGEVTIRVPGNETTGLVWTAKSSDEAVLALRESQYIPDEAPEGMVGVGGVSEFVFAAVAPGSAVVDLTWQRPWEENAEAARTLAFDVSDETIICGACLQGDETFILTLFENPSTGYLWSLAMSAQGVCALTGDEYVPAPGSEDAVGTGGTRVLTFVPEERGDTQLMLTLARGEDIAQTFVFALSVDYDVEDPASAGLE